MTDARLRGEWLTAAAHDGLTDAAYRVFHNALMHSAEQGTDGAIAMRELRFLYPGVLEPSVLDELERAGFWTRTEAGYQLEGWSTTLGQSTAAEVETYRRKARERMQRRRDQAKTAQGTDTDSESPQRKVVRANVRANERENVTGDVGQDRTGPFRASPALKKGSARVSAERAPGSGAIITVLPGRQCPPGEHRLVADGSCMRCDIRPGEES